MEDEVERTCGFCYHCIIIFGTPCCNIRKNEDCPEEFTCDSWTPDE